MGNLVVNQCEFGCGIVGHWDLEKQEQIGETLEEHYKHCPNIYQANFHKECCKKETENCGDIQIE